MWFAAYGNAADNPWFIAFVTALLEGRPQVTALLAADPFPHRPPQQIRALLYDYRFAPPGSGAWWERRETGLFLPPLDLSRLHAPAPEASP